PRGNGRRRPQDHTTGSEPTRPSVPSCHPHPAPTTAAGSAGSPERARAATRSLRQGRGSHQRPAPVAYPSSPPLPPAPRKTAGAGAPSAALLPDPSARRPGPATGPTPPTGLERRGQTKPTRRRAPAPLPLLG